MHHQHARVRSASIRKLSLAALLTGALVCGAGLAPALAEPASPVPSPEASATTETEAPQAANGVEPPPADQRGLSSTLRPQRSGSGGSRSDCLVGYDPDQ